TDHLGTPVKMYDEHGEQVWSCELDIYGNVRKFILKGDHNACPFRYPGQYEDVETGLYYNRFRYYSPHEGMYTQQDPIGLAGGIRLYGYVDDPIIWVDVFGLKKNGGGSGGNSTRHCETGEGTGNGSPKFSPNFDTKLRKHAQDIYTTSKALGVQIVKGDKEGMKKFILSIVNDSKNLANSKPFNWNTIESVDAFVKGDAVVLVNRNANEILTFLNKKGDRLSSKLKSELNLIRK
uniref:RHS repeat domain-containing protein n=1 Tax=Paenibacillus fonticola TaxID=379896 RepID=UPI001969EAA3